MKTNTQQRYQIIRLTVVNGTIINQTNENNGLRLDPGFNKITGISVQEIANGGIPLNYQVGARNDRKVWVDPVNIQNWLAAAGVAPDLKYLSVNIDYNDGDTFYATIKNQAALTADLTIEMTLRLEKDLTEINK